jgi:hypothetical protein
MDESCPYRITVACLRCLEFYCLNDASCFVLSFVSVFGMLNMNVNK